MDGERIEARARMEATWVAIHGSPEDRQAYASGDEAGVGQMEFADVPEALASMGLREET